MADNNYGIPPELLEQLLKLIRGQQYDYLLKNPGASETLGMQAPGNAVPLNDAIVKMAYGMLPGWAQTGAQGGGTGTVDPLAGGGPRDNPVDPNQGGTGAGRGGRGGAGPGETQFPSPGLDRTFPWNTDMSATGQGPVRSRAGDDSGYVGDSVRDLDRNYDPNRTQWYDHWYIPPLVRAIGKVTSKGK